MREWMGANQPPIPGSLLMRWPYTLEVAFYLIPARPYYFSVFITSTVLNHPTLTLGVTLYLTTYPPLRKVLPTTESQLIPIIPFVKADESY